MVLTKLIFILLFCYVCVNSTELPENDYYTPHITAVLKYLNSNPNKIYEYKKGVLVNAQQKADIVELSINIDVVCVVNTQYLGVPCSERQQICNGFVQRNVNENDYKVLSDVSCKPNGDSSTETIDELTTLLPSSQQSSNIELSHEAVSSEHNADFVAVKADRGPCLGCPIDLNINGEGVSTLVDGALQHVETERDHKHVLVKIISLQQQIVAGIKYILVIEIAPTVCQKGVDLSNNRCPIDENASTSVCQVEFLQRPWINKLKYIISNNCTVSQEYSLNVEKQDEKNSGNKVNTNSDFDTTYHNLNPTSEISLAALSDLESQILPLEHEKNKPITERALEIAVTANIQEGTKDRSNIEFQEPIIQNNRYAEGYIFNKDKSDTSRQETGTIKAVNEIADSEIATEKVVESESHPDQINQSENGSGSSGGDIEVNRVKRSIDDELKIKKQCTKHHKIYHRHGVVGAPAALNQDDPRILNFVTDTLSELDSVSEYPNRYKIVDIVSATSQVVSGSKYKIQAKISLSNCLKNDPTSLKKCKFLQNTDITVCDIVVWERRWLHKRKITVKCDNNDRVYTFENSQPKNKRSLHGEHLVNGFHKLKSRSKRDVEQLNSITGSLVNENEIDSRILEYVKHGLQHLDSKSVYETKYMLKRIVKVSKQTIAGRLWHITVEVALSSCPKSSYTESCEELNNEHKICNFEVWEQPWLTTIPKISTFCENYTSLFSPLTQATFGRFGKKVLSMFQFFMSTYKKSYSDEIELNHRLKVFKDNLNTIKLLNKYEQGTGRYGITEFTDLTAKEFSKSHGLRVDLHNENYIPYMTAATPNITLPLEFDWREKGAVTKVKNQGSCGSCWAFSTTGNIEGQYAIKYGKLLEFSEQELVDCDKLDDGCSGGLMDNAYRYIEEIGGLESESDYPYDAEDEKCHFNKSKVEVQIAGALNISHNETDMAKWLVKNGPISIAINANAMQFYMGGVSHPWRILCNPKNLDHGVLIVGYGVHTYPLFNKTLPYWIVKNSWGASWGEQGYYRVYRGDGTCGLNQTPSSAIVA